MQKNIAIINPEDFGYDLAVLAGKKGYAVTGVMIETPDRYQALKNIYCFDTNELAGAYNQLITVEHWEDAVWQLRKQNPSAVISGSEIAVDYTDHIAAELGLPCNDPASIPLRRNKIEMKRAVRNAGLQYARGDIFNAFPEAAAFVRNNCGYPVVVKPVCGAGSKNVSVCRNETEFARAFMQVQYTPDAYLRSSNSVLVEEYIDGNEYVVNMLGTPDEVRITDIWKYEKISNAFSDCIYYNDIMQDLNDPLFDELRAYAIKVYRAVGIRIGPAHAEIKLPNHGPVLIEIGSRLAGGEMPKYAAAATNCNSLEKTLDIFINGTTVFPDKIMVNSFVASADISHERFGRIIKYNGLEKVRELPSYKAEVLYSKPGVYIEPTRDVDHLVALFWFMSTECKQIRTDLEKSHKLCTVSVRNDRVLVVGTTSDYIDLLRNQYADQLLFITDRNLRENAAEQIPAPSEELQCNLHDFNSILEAVRTHASTYKQTITGITCFDCESLLLASFLAEKLRLPFPSSDTVRNCRSKQKSITLWKRAKIGCPETTTGRSYEEALAFFEKAGGPCVIKPETGSGAELTFKCTTKEELAHTWDTVMMNLPAKADTPMYSASCGGSPDAIIQKYIDGTEYSCDFIVSGGKTVILRLCRKYFEDYRFGITKTYELLPPGLWPETPAALSSLLYRAAKALGNLSGAICMVDFIKTDNGFMLLEMTPRAGGDCLPYLLKKASGTSTLSVAVELAAGRLKKPETLPVKAPLAVLRLFAKKSGIIFSQNTKSLTAAPCVQDIVLYRKNGYLTDILSNDYTKGLLGYAVFSPEEQDTVQQISRLDALFNPDIRSLDETVQQFVKGYLLRKDTYLDLFAAQGRRPLWIFDKVALTGHAEKFRSAFEKRLDDCAFFYAMKSNNYPDIARILCNCGFGLDVSSGIELAEALASGAKKIEFSGPGKTNEELELALAHTDKVTVLMDSFSELERLKVLTEKHRTVIHTGIRILPPGGWEKFGIVLSDLGRFFSAAASCSFIKLDGIQFHTSWNMDSTRQITALRALSLELKTWQPETAAQIKFLDIGGGYWPEEGEWLQGKQAAKGCSAGRTWNPSATIEQAAEELSAVIKSDIFPLVRCQIRFEPGRWIVNDAMHILVSVIDKKSDICVITDGATNTVGWDRFQSDYFPVINLTHPAAEEHECRIYGSLCDPHDAWGFSYCGSSIEAGDVLLIPDQGAYTYSLQQHFIKPLPRVIPLS
jgi:diaminopimelate decarboxylase